VPPDFRATRSSVERWREILIPTYDELLRLGAGDVWVYGSQAMSLYMKRPFASRDLDLLVTGVGTRMIEKLCKTLASLTDQKAPTYYFKKPEHEGKPNPVFGIYLHASGERPFAIELFQTYNGHDVRELTPYSNYVKRWNKEFQTLSIEAIIGTQLSFRPPDRISAFNAQRLNLFLKTVKRKIDWIKVEEFARRFHLEAMIDANLKVLKGQGVTILDSDKLALM
jgi:hypothetical protein